MLPLVIFSVVLILTDLYVFKGFSLLIRNVSPLWLQKGLKITFWLVPFALISSVSILLHINTGEKDLRIFNAFIYIMGFTVLFYVPRLFFILFHLTDDIVLLYTKIKHFFHKGAKPENSSGSEKMSRSGFITRVGVIAAGLPFLGILNGITRGRFNFNVIYKKIAFGNLPQEFNGFRIVQISDLHMGGFHGYYDRLAGAVEIINEQEADVIFHTGDIINNFASELHGFRDLLASMKSGSGKFSVLGNHDYGDYFQWSSKEAKEKNMAELLNTKEKMGFTVLNNDSCTLTSGNEKIAVIGVENWGLPPFPQYGNLPKAMENTESIPFTILLTHDPTHWDEEVLGKTGIDLTCAGHTHGMQFGIETANIKWSPIRRMYPRWAGLYRENNQYLYVNRGRGITAFPGRVGMPPEITVIELIKS